MSAIDLVILKSGRRYWYGALIAFAMVAVWTPRANAMPEFPGEIQNHLQMSETPPCTLCHATINGGGPMATPFGQIMVSAGLNPGDVTSVDRALDKLEQHKIDSNHDGQTDVEELRAGVNPNTGQPFSGQEKFGCGARVAPGIARIDSGFALAAVLAAMAMFVRRRGRRP